MESPMEGVPSPYNDSLLFQFILAEFLQAHLEITALESLLQQQSNIDGNQNLLDHHRKLLYKTRAFAGPSLSLQSVYSWQEEIGTLTKFKNYVRQFQQESSQKLLLTFKKQVHKSWLLSLGLRDINDNFHCLKPFTKVLAKVRHSMGILNKQMIQLIPQFRDDESVIFFILKRQELFDRVFGVSFTLNQLKSMHSELQHSGKFLLKSFKERHFEKLLPIISQKIAYLEQAP